MISKRLPNRPVTAKELLLRLQQDPAYLQRRAEKEAQRLQIVEVNARDSLPVLADLEKAGYKLNWISDLYQQEAPYTDAIPILLSWLPRIDNKDIKETIVRALSVPWTPPSAAALLIEEFKRVQDSTDIRLRWAIGNALSVIADDNAFTGVAALAQDKQYGRTREMVALALGNMKDPRAVDVLIGLLDDDEVAGYALIALGKLRAKKARDKIETFLTHPKAWVRKEAQRALKKIDRTK